MGEFYQTLCELPSFYSYLALFLSLSLFMPSSSSSSTIHLFTRRPKGSSNAKQASAVNGNGNGNGSMKSSSNGFVEVKKEKVVRYRECRKNHAASIGGYAVDGCREFMASGEEGTAAALRCAACNCHRSFHKREVESEAVVCDCSSNSNSSAGRN